ncbi:hypothetical protein F5Y14DRAFT_182648 [Nemania sp. NC0429]|nr:hypothetical protein F5Y14DRAFT_182648 [Nemania sp. NC0429]
MPDPPSAGEPKSGSARPSFTGYWKRSKDQQAAQSLTFVSSKLGQSSAQGGGGGDGSLKEPSAEVKAKERRQQVRRAQRQHRQRKANYTKQLEMDVTKLRDDIARVEMEMESLKSQNDAIRSRLAAPTAVTAVPPPVVDDDVTGTDTDMAFSTLLAPNYTVSLDMSELLGAPVYQVRRASPPPPPPHPGPDRSSEASGSPCAAETLSSTTPASTAGTSVIDVMAMEMELSQEQTDRVINFILALERCCWDHIDQSCFEHHYRHEHSHSVPHAHPQPHPPKSHPPNCPILAGVLHNDDDNDDNIDDDIDIDVDIHADVDVDEYENDGSFVANNVNGHTLMATALALQSAPPDVFARIGELQKSSAACPGGGPAAVEWSSNTLTLANLRRLAGTLNPSDSELAPVQVWYELARLCGVPAATDPVVLAALQRELAGQVHCVVFGAVVRRSVFEDALERVVVGFVPPRPWDGEAGLGGFGLEGEVEVMDLGEEEAAAGGYGHGHGHGEGIEAGVEVAARQEEKRGGSGIFGRLIHSTKGRR